ncbi:hypothetical protein [Granulicatella elegans]|uniref:hypothetical protein n=1 Tax=Granulicatella elegans TaxID=137732 RepID=UPI001D1568B3|nr:hypothetical protein [Granulicatella elegans]UEA30943.1 hypothetical protein LK443_06595 [Granulicatella elegans]
MMKNRLSYQKIKASLVVPFLSLLFITSLVTVALYQIRVANANQFRLLRDTYRLKIMLELTTQNLDSHLEVKDNEMNFPSRIDFSTGNVEIKWDEKNKAFDLTAHLKNGSTRSEKVYLVVNEKKVNEKTQ